MKQFKFDHLSFSEIGTRKTNEDVVFKYQSDSFNLYMVADGIGGYDNGDLAAKSAITTIADNLVTYTNGDFEDGIKASFEKADKLIKSNFIDAGTTLGGLLITADAAVAFWLGDIRIAILADSFCFSSTDHTLYNVLKENNLLIRSGDEERTKNTLTRSLGGKSNSWIPEIAFFQTDEIRRAIICSDGVHRHQNINGLLAGVSINADQITHSLKDIGRLSKDNYSAIYLWNMR